MNIAIEGCLHGELQQVYKHLKQLQSKSKIQIDLLLICGDFQAMRDMNDLDHMHCPPKYKAMGDFQDYFSGKKVAPFVTVFIGGNHQAVNYMRDLHFGGWCAPKIYYLGQAGSIIVKNKRTKTSVKIGGLSGIYNHRDFQYILKTQRIPLYGKDRITAYHIKQLDVFRMQLLSRIYLMKKQKPEIYGQFDSGIDIFLSHDWPKDIAFYGNLDELYKYKSFLKKQIDQGMFGSPPMMRLMKLAKPSYWFAAHMHIKYSAIFPHQNDEYTHFLALDKCLQNRSCLQVLNFQRKQTNSHENMEPNQQQEQQQQQEKQQKYSQKKLLSEKQPQNKNTSSIDDNIQIYHDPTWLSVLRLTTNHHNKPNTYYKYDNNQNYQNIKLSNSKLMNQYIQKYGQLHKQIQSQYQNNQQALLCRSYFRKYNQQGQNTQKFDESEQTIQLLTKLLKANLNIFAGTILSHERIEAQGKQQKVEEENNGDDQIQLDL